MFLALLIKLSQRSYRARWYMPGLWNSLSGSSAEVNASYLAIVIELAPQNALRAQRGAPQKKEIMEPVPTPSEIDPACGGDPRSSIVSRSRVGADIDTRTLDWEVNGEQQSAPQPVVLL